MEYLSQALSMAVALFVEARWLRIAAFNLSERMMRLQIVDLNKDGTETILGTYNVDKFKPIAWFTNIVSNRQNQFGHLLTCILREVA